MIHQKNLLWDQKPSIVPKTLILEPIVSVFDHHCNVPMSHHSNLVTHHDPDIKSHLCSDNYEFYEMLRDSGVRPPPGRGRTPWTPVGFVGYDPGVQPGVGRRFCVNFSGHIEGNRLTGFNRTFLEIRSGGRESRWISK
jgi:hypothetical protein